MISDAFTLCHANLMPCQITMNLVTYLPKEQNWGPMTTGLRHLEKWRRILKYSECFLMLTEVVKQILSKPVNAMGWNNVGKDEVKYVDRYTVSNEYQFRCLKIIQIIYRLLRPEVLLAAVLWEDAEAINQAKQLLHNFLTHGAVIPANLREVCFHFFDITNSTNLKI